MSSLAKFHLWIWKVFSRDLHSDFGVPNLATTPHCKPRPPQIFPQSLYLLVSSSALKYSFYATSISCVLAILYGPFQIYLHTSSII